MAFYSVAFIGFVLLFIIIHELAGKMCSRYQWIVRLLAGLSFFVYLSGIRIVFILASAVTVWGGAMILARVEEKNKAERKREGLSKEEKKAIKERANRSKKATMYSIAAFNLLLLIAVKYMLPSAGHPVALPLGISFYTLMAIAYLVDVYGGKYEPQGNYAKVLLYLCWFPQLIQGPINRFDLIKDDLYTPYRINASDFRYAVYLFLFGAVKKYAIADLLAPMVNASLNNDSAGYPGSFVLFGALMFAIEQYADFSGGIDMSMAVSLLFGVKMNENFRQPYFSTSLAQFWRRWHITLGGWMRDYVFYPFAMLKPVANLNKTLTKRFGAHAGRAVVGGIGNIIVFALVGLWHGPETHYLFWGLYNGLIIAASDALSPVFLKINVLLHLNTESKGMYVFRIFRTFMIVVFAGFFDVIGPVRTGLACFTNTFLRFGAQEGSGMISGMFADGVTSVQAVVTATVAGVLLFINSFLRERGVDTRGSLCKKGFGIRWIVCFGLILLLLYSFTVSSGIRGFMYAAF